jgi:hypothetical protein
MPEGRCDACDAQGFVTEMHGVTEGGRMVRQGALCKRCRNAFMLMLEGEARREAGEAPFDQVDTGQRLPDGLAVTRGVCSQCGRDGDRATARVEAEGVPQKNMLPCAECLADLVVGASRMGIAHIISRRTDGRWVRLSDKPPAP